MMVHHIDDEFETPLFEYACCERYGYNEVRKIVEDHLIRYSDTPIYTGEALIMAIRLCVFRITERT